MRARMRKEFAIPPCGTTLPVTNCLALCGLFVVLASGASYAGESFGKQVITLTGYAADCTVAKCAPIVH